MVDHAKRGRDILQHLGDVVTHLAHFGAPAIRADAVRIVPDIFTGKVIGQRLLRGLQLARGIGPPRVIGEVCRRTGLDAFPEHRELRRREMRRAVSRRWPGEATLLEDLVVDAEALAVPVKQLDPAATPAAEREHRTGTGVFPENRAGRGRQVGDAFAHIGDATGEISPNSGSGADRASSSARTRRRRASVPISGSTRRARPLPARSRPGSGSDVGDCASADPPAIPIAQTKKFPARARNLRRFCPIAPALRAA